MLKVVINSYTCCPGMGSEPGMGWNWIVALAKHCELYVISEGEYKVQCEEASKDMPIHWYWNPVPQATRDKCWNQGNWSFYPLYAEWQRKTADIAREICRTEKIDVLHQLNMIGFREPGFLHEVSRETGIPLIWGPVDAKGSFPMAYTEGAAFKTKVFLAIKNILNYVQLKWMPRAHAVAKQATFVISASSNSRNSFKKYFGIDSPLINETGCRNNDGPASLRSKKQPNERFDILWVGKMDFRKQLAVALRTVSLVKHNNICLHVVGGGDNAQYIEQAKELGVSEKVFWHGAVSHNKVQDLMASADVMLFTSVAEGTPHVVLESLANGLPVVCHDTCGHGDSVNNSCGVKIPVESPKVSAACFAEIIDELIGNPERLQEMSECCYSRSRELSWDNKAKEVLKLYQIAYEKSRKINISMM